MHKFEYFIQSRSNLRIAAVSLIMTLSGQNANQGRRLWQQRLNRTALKTPSYWCFANSSWRFALHFDCFQWYGQVGPKWCNSVGNNITLHPHSKARIFRGLLSRSLKWCHSLQCGAEIKERIFVLLMYHSFLAISSSLMHLFQLYKNLQTFCRYLISSSYISHFTRPYFIWFGNHIDSFAQYKIMPADIKVYVCSVYWTTTFNWMHFAFTYKINVNYFEICPGRLLKLNQGKVLILRENFPVGEKWHLTLMVRTCCKLLILYWIISIRPLYHFVDIWKSDVQLSNIAVWRIGSILVSKILLIWARWCNSCGKRTAQLLNEKVHKFLSKFIRELSVKHQEHEDGHECAMLRVTHVCRTRGSIRQKACGVCAHA